MDPLEFHLAEILGMSLSDIRNLPNSEIEEWRAWFEVKAQKQELENMKARTRGDRR